LLEADRRVMRITFREISSSRLETMSTSRSHHFVALFCFHVKGKLAPRFIGPYRIGKRIGKLAYKLELPEELVGVHLVFHVSQLRKCLKLPEEQVPTEALDLQDTLEYREYLIQILD
jgi:hypothetical protein